MTKILLPNVSGGKDDSLTLDDWKAIYHALLDYRDGYEGDMPNDEFVRWLVNVLSVKAKIREMEK